MSKQIVTGIDIGTDSVKVVVSQRQDDGSLTVLGTGRSQASGVRHGYIIDPARVTASIRRALDNAVQNSSVRPLEAYVSVGGIGVGATEAQGETHITTIEGVITEKELDQVTTNAHAKCTTPLLNRKVIHEVPLEYKIDGQTVLTGPLGLKTSHLAGRILFINALEQHIDDFIAVVENAGVEVIDVTAAPLAASIATLTTPQKIQGCVLIDIGAETTDVLVFENNTPRILSSLPMGGTDITNALAVQLTIPTIDAEKLKRDPSHHSNKKAVEKIIDRSLTDIFSEVKKTIAEARKSNILPAGALITGGGSLTYGAPDVAKRVLGLPARVVRADTSGVDHNPELVVAYGLCVWGLASETEGSLTKVRQWFAKLANWFRQFLP